MNYNVDVVICSKDREKMCKEQIERVQKYIPYNKLIIADSSEKPYNLDEYIDNITYIHTPNYKLGNVRTMTYNMCNSYLFMSLDDDIVINENTFSYMLECLLSNDRNIAVSGLCINGYPDNKTIMNYTYYMSLF
jgi:GT2 family glycosyltransferase